MTKKYDIVVIGGGPGGYVAAIRAAQLGKKVAIIEKSSLGGVCLNWGCIPTKSLLKNAYVLDLIKNASKYGIDIPEYSVNWDKVIKRSRNIAKRLSKGIEYLMNKNKIDFINAKAVLKDSHTILINDSKEEIKSDFIILATGTTQKNLPGLTIDGKQIISSKEAMILDHIPKRMVIIGAGAIGVEFAHLYNTFGSDVTMIEAMPNILPNEDEDISKELSSIFSKRKIKLLTGKIVDKVSKSKKGVKLSIGKEIIESDIVLVAVGVTGNISNLGLKKIGIKTSNGFIDKNTFLQTSVKNIYAIGDVIDKGPMLAHKAEDEGIAVAEIIDGQAGHVNYDVIPGVVYTSPEVATVGKTEEQLKKNQVNYKVGKFSLMANSRAKTINETEGFVKILADSKTDKILGAHMIGSNAGELIAEMALAMEFGASSEDIARTCHAHPTFSEALKESALAVDKRAIHS